MIDKNAYHYIDIKERSKNRFELKLLDKKNSIIMIVIGDKVTKNFIFDCPGVEGRRKYFNLESEQNRGHGF